MAPDLVARIFDHTLDLVAVARPDGSILYLNRRGEEGAETPVHLSALQPEWAWQTVSAEGLALALESGSWTGESAMLDAKGREVPVRLTLLSFGAGEEQQIVATMRDLTELKRREVESIEFANRYETAIRMSGHVLLDWEPWSGKLVCSGDLQGLLGCEAGALSGELNAFRALIHPADLPHFDREVERTVKTRDSLAVTFRLRQSDGAYRSVRAAGGYYMDREGRLGKITALLSDGELLRAARLEAERLEARLDLSVEAQVREARQETERANRARSEFLSRMSHELRTPLNAILGFTQLLELDGPTASQQESIDHISRAGNHLLSLINEVLDLSRVESGRLAMQLEAIPLAANLQELVQLVRPRADREGISVVLDLPTPPGWCMHADGQRLRQVMVNLLSNAVKFNRPGGRITVRTTGTGEGQVRISFIDTGIGIAPEKLERIYVPLEKYRRAAHDGSAAGLGLALSKGLIEAMGGRIGAESVLGEGSTFWLELPLLEDADAAPRTSRVQEGSGDESTELEQTTLLYVEDEELNLQLVRRVLCDYPQYHLVSTSKGLLALPLAREHRPALILLDLNLPDLPGEQVLEQLQADPATRDVPVIMVTADIMGSRLERMLSSGAVGYLTKPFRIADLIRIIRDTLASRKRVPVHESETAGQPEV